MPLVVRTPGGAGLGMAAQHSQSLEGMLTNIPGLIIIAPGTAGDAKGLLKAAIRSNNPVVFFENKLAYASIGPVLEGDRVVPIGVAQVARAGTDVTLVPIGGALITAQAAAAELARDGIDVEIIDPRTLVPLDLAAIVTSVCKTGRLVTLEEAPYTHGFGAEIVARVCDHAFSALRAGPRRVAAADVPIPTIRSSSGWPFPTSPAWPLPCGLRSGNSPFHRRLEVPPHCPQWVAPHAALAARLHAKP